MNDQNRYRGGSSQRNQNEGRGSAWSRDDDPSALDRGNPPRSRSSYGGDRNQSFPQRSEVYGGSSEDRFGNDRPFEAQDREYRGGSSNYGRSRDYQNDWSGFGGQGGSYGEQNPEDDRVGSYGSNQDAGRGAGSYSSSRYGIGSRSNYGSYGSGGSSSALGRSNTRSDRGWDAASSTSGSAATSYSGRGPKGYTRSDERIREDVCERLSDNDDVDASEIEVQVKDRKVTLTGTVQNRRMKHIAEDLAEAVSGVDDVDNRITVTKPFFKDMADRITGNEGEQHFANTGTKNGPSTSSAAAGGLQSANGRA